MSLIERVYPSLPVFAQNILITGKGLLLRRERFGGAFKESLARAIAEAELSHHDLLALQLQRLQSFLIFANEYSAFYREQFAAVDFVPSKLHHIDDLRQLPVLEKGNLRLNAESIKSSNAALKLGDPIYTSGTTGTPLKVAYSIDDVRERVAILFRMFKRHGIKPFEKSVRFSGRALFPDAERDGVFWRMNWAANQMFMSSYDLHPKNMRAYVDRLRRFEPVVIDGYPSSIFIIARFINQSGQTGEIRPKLIMTTAETLEDYQREEIARAFGGCRVINQYASSEGAPFITEDEHGDLVVNIDTGVFEFVKPGTNEPAQGGDIAEMIVTSFTTHAYPLIRYRVGDTVLLPEKPRLARSWQMPVVERIIGRQEDIIYTPFRGYSGNLNKVFASSPSTIIESQIVQTSETSITLRVVVAKKMGFSASDLDTAIKELRERLGPVSVDIEYYEKLPRGSNGKLRAVIGLQRFREEVTGQAQTT